MLLKVFLTCSIFHRCVYELFVAQKSGVKVKLCPYVHEYDVKYGNLDADICISRNIGTRVDSKNLHCSYLAHKIAIHEAIKKFGTSSLYEEVNECIEFI